MGRRPASVTAFVLLGWCDERQKRPGVHLLLNPHRTKPGQESSQMVKPATDPEIIVFLQENTGETRADGPGRLSAPADARVLNGF